jgi:hypothetical protein
MPSALFINSFSFPGLFFASEQKCYSKYFPNFQAKEALQYSPKDVPLSICSSTLVFPSDAPQAAARLIVTQLCGPTKPTVKKILRTVQVRLDMVITLRVYHWSSARKWTRLARRRQVSRLNDCHFVCNSQSASTPGIIVTASWQPHRAAQVGCLVHARAKFAAASHLPFLLRDLGTQSKRCKETDFY